MLCRILTELKLLQSQVGVVVLSAGVGNDVVGWILLALSVALVNAGSGITALYVLLTAVAYILFLVYAVRPVFMWILKRTNCIHNGPSQSIVALTVLMVLGSAFFTGIIGIHPIFGAFLVGLICPHDGGFAIKLTEKIEDLVTVFFLPLYFALSGLSTNIGLLDNGITWAYVVGVVAVAFLGKMIGGTLAARANKLVWRESFTIGVLMSCKGLVELIVLNIGLQAKILSQRTFTIFVVMALITTFATTPLTSFLFPPWYQTKLAAWKRGEIDWDGRPLNREESAGEASAESVEKTPTGEIRKLLIALGLDSLPTIFTFMDLLRGGKLEEKPAIVHPSLESKEASSKNAMTMYRPLKVHGLRMLGVTERMSSVMQEPELDELSTEDPIIKAFHTFGQLHSLTVSGSVKLVPEDSYANVLTSSATATHSDMILLPWTEVASPSASLLTGRNESPASSMGYNDPSSAQYVESVLEHAPCSTAIFINNGFGIQLSSRNLPRLPSLRSLRRLDSNAESLLPTVPALERSHHIFLPFFGGVDDYVALMLLLQLARNPIVTATVMRMPSSSSSKAGSIASVPQTLTLLKSGTPTVTTATVPETSMERDAEFFNAARNSLPQERGSRVMFCEADTGRGIVELANGEVGLNARNAGDLVITGRRHGTRGHAPGHVMGDTAALLMKAGVKASFCVVQAGKGNVI